MEMGTSTSNTVYARTGRTRTWLQRAWTFGVTGAAAGALTVLLLVRAGASGSSAGWPPSVGVAALGPLEVPNSAALDPSGYAIIIVGDEAQAARVRVSLAEGAAFVPATESPSMAFEVIVAGSSTEADDFMGAVQASNGLLAGTGREVAVIDAREG